MPLQKKQNQKIMLLYTEKNYLLGNFTPSFPVGALPLNYKPHWGDSCPPGRPTLHHSWLEILNTPLPPAGGCSGLADPPKNLAFTLNIAPRFSTFW